MTCLPSMPETPALACDLFAAAYTCLHTPALADKLATVHQLDAAWRAGTILWENSPTPVEPIGEIGRPERPELRAPRDMQARGMGTVEGRATMLHAIAHIEFNAIHLALDAVYRFRGLPRDFYAGWLTVAREEAEHFALVCAHLETAYGKRYGDYPAHNGLWELAQQTAGDLLPRMALVPRLMEARGLDVTPGIMAKFQAAGDTGAVAVLEVILREEIGHVALGDHWFRTLCRDRGLEPEATFVGLLAQHAALKLTPPFNRAARLQAGFSPQELDTLEQLSRPSRNVNALNRAAKL